MDSPAAVCGVMDKHYVTENVGSWQRRKISFAKADSLGKTLVSCHEPEDLPISVDYFKFSRKDAKAYLLFINDTVLMCVVGSEG